MVAEEAPGDAEQREENGPTGNGPVVQKQGVFHGSHRVGALALKLPTHRRTLNPPSKQRPEVSVCKKEYEGLPREDIMGENPVLVAASAPGKCILFGEHAVVYGQPAVAVAIAQRMSVSLALNEDWRIDGMSFHPQRHPHVEALRQRLWEGGPPLSVKILGDIPPASGLGSSAALSVAASAALRCARGRQIKDDDWAEDGLRRDQTESMMDLGKFPKEILYGTVQNLWMKMNVQF